MQIEYRVFRVMTENAVYRVCACDREAAVADVAQAFPHDKIITVSATGEVR